MLWRCYRCEVDQLVMRLKLGMLDMMVMVGIS